LKNAALIVESGVGKTCSDVITELHRHSYSTVINTSRRQRRF
jgi:hypothetical protein